MELPTKRVAATVLFTDERGRVLIVDPTYKPRWELPGGMVENGESPRAAAVREIAEELGITCRPGRLLAVDYAPATEERTEGVIIVFDGGALESTAALRLPADELSRFAFVEPAHLADYLPEPQTRRALASLEARHATRTAYLECGLPPA